MQIFEEVAISQVRSLTTEEDKGSVTIAMIHGSGDPKSEPNGV